MDFNREWICYRLNFEIEKLKYFDLVYENEFFRVFHIIENSSERNYPKIGGYHPLYDKKHFEDFVNDGDINQKAETY